MSEVGDLIKKGNKNKLIQLAIDSKEFDYEGIPENYRTLTDEEIDLIYKKAKEEGWIKELHRAKEKAKDIEKLTYKAQVELWKALYYLQEFTQLLHKTEAILGVLENEYLDIEIVDDKEVVVKSKVKKTKEKIKEDVGRVSGAIDVFTLTNILIQSKARAFTEEEGSMGNKRARIFEIYKYYISNAKLLTYLVVSTDMDGYRLYLKEAVEELDMGLSFINLTGVFGVGDSLEHIRDLIENLNEHTPEVIEVIKEENRLYIPSKDEVKKITDYLEEKVLYEPAVEELRVTVAQRGKPKIFNKEYLLNELSEEKVKEIEEKDRVLKEYIKYGTLAEQYGG